MHFQLLVQLILILIGSFIFNLYISLSLQVAFKVLERFSFYFLSLVTVAVKLI